MKPYKKQLSEADIAKMADAAVFVSPSMPRPNIPRTRQSVPEFTSDRIDFHGKTEEQAWALLVALIENHSGTATVITGASGILKDKFQQWVAESIISDRIVSCCPINRGSFQIGIRKKV
jgi:DNA-nicking Smr family endonuclease